MSGFLSGLEGSAWLKHIRAILETAHFVAQALATEGVSVLVHCSDGWDRTAQVCSVAQLLIDPHYRTIQGFQVSEQSLLFKKSSKPHFLLGLNASFFLFSFLILRFQ